MGIGGRGEGLEDAGWERGRVCVCVCKDWNRRGYDRSQMRQMKEDVEDVEALCSASHEWTRVRAHALLVRM